MSDKHKHDEYAFLISQESAKLGHQLPEDEIAKVLEIIEDTYTKTNSKLLEDHFDELTIKYAKNNQLIIMAQRSRNGTPKRVNESCPLRVYWQNMITKALFRR